MEDGYNKRKIGSTYEDMAAAYLEEHGYKILERNFHAGRYGELDILAESEDGTLIVCECKFRSGNKYGDPLAAVDRRKQRQICKTTMYYYMRHGYGMEHPCRFDVIGIYGDGTIKHIENAFDFQG